MQGLTLSLAAITAAEKHTSGIFLGLNSKMSKNFSKMVYIIPNFLLLHFGEDFMKIQSKILKLQMHKKLYKNVNENMFSF